MPSQDDCPPPAADTLDALLVGHFPSERDRDLPTGSQVFRGAELADAIAIMAAGLRSASIGYGDRVALWMTNGVRYVTAMFALARIGAVAVHINTRFGVRDVVDLIGRTCPRLVLADIDPGLDKVNATITEIRHSLVSSGVALIDAADLPSHPPECQFDGQADDDCLIFTTGGTTSRPKLVVHSQRSIVAAARQIAKSIGLFEPDSCLLAAVPFCGTFGNNLVMAAIAANARIVTMAVFEPRRAEALIRLHNVTHAVGDDSMIARLAAAAGSVPFASMRFFGAAAFGANCTAAFAAGTAAGLPIHGIYGSSELQTFFGLGDVRDNGFGPVVPIYPEAEIRVIDGELCARSPSLFNRYLDEPDLTAAAVIDGWFHTGDRVRILGDGFVYEGRSGDVLRLGGFLVAPQEIESFLVAQPAVLEAVVVAVESEGVTRPVGFVLAADGFDEAAILTTAHVQIARYKIPVRLLRVDAFPVVEGPNGPKISRAQLRRLAESALASPLSPPVADAPCD